MRRMGVKLEDKEQAEIIDKARAKRSRRDATRKGTETTVPAAAGGDTGGVAEALKDMAHEAVATVEQMVTSASDKIKDMVEGSPSVAVDAKKPPRRGSRRNNAGKKTPS